MQGVLIILKTYNLSFFLQNRRPDYISLFVEKLVSWEAVSSRLEAAKAHDAQREIEEERKRKEVEKTPESEDDELYVDNNGDDSEAD